MKSQLITVVVGLLAGAIGAFAATHLAAAPVASSQRESAQPAREQPVVVPPGWDAQYLERLGSVESQVAALSERAQRVQAQLAAAQEKAPPPAAASPQATEREAERAAHYEKELDDQRNRLADHQAEATDSVWAGQQSEALRTALGEGAASHAYQIRSIDCRSSTCVSDLSFPSPGEALQYLNRAPVTGDCHGVIVTPTPPTSGGEYDLQLVYNCR